MTLRRTKGRGRRVVGDMIGNPDMLYYAPPRLKHRGISRRPRTTAKPPLTEAHELVLAALADEPTRAVDVRTATGLTTGQVHSALYALSARELATKTGGGWVRIANKPTGDDA